MTGRPAKVPHRTSAGEAAGGGQTPSPGRAGPAVLTPPGRRGPAVRAGAAGLQFEASRSIDDPDSFILYEACTDEDAFQAHRDSPHSAENAGHAIVPLLFQTRPGTLPTARPPARDSNAAR
jgi:hypothetical protein